jgi:hypothetical protein
VGEDRSGQVDGNFLEGLALRLVDGHGESRPDRKLQGKNEPLDLLFSSNPILTSS